MSPAAVTHVPEPTTLKHALADAGFDVYRSQGEVIQLAERPRPNLILDSGVAVRATPELRTRIVFRSAKSHFPEDSDEQLLERARMLGQTARRRGYEEVEASIAAIRSPSAPEEVLDTHFEIALERPVANLEDLVEELQKALAEPRETLAAE